MIHIREIDHLALRVRELQPMPDFCCAVLGRTVAAGRPAGLRPSAIMRA